MGFANQKERLSPLTGAQIREYGENGYVLLRGGCSHDLIDAFNAHIYTIRSSDDMPDWAKPRAGVVVSPADRFSVRLFNPHRHDGFALQMMKLPVIRGALAQLMGGEACGVQSMYFYKEPGSKGQAAHQDYYYIQNEPRSMIAGYVALERIDEDNGCLRVVPGSHKLGLLPHGAVRNKEEHEPWTDETEGVDLSREIPVVMEKGDILFFHELLVHSSTRNRTKDRWRRSYVCHYIRHDSEITQREDLKKKIRLDD
ncbi:phytanoyl-CoA dioxygenase family protein [Paenibacillus flagellatus]|uniref:Phytanoyl-CoA dioxygenase family protein n=1 Tax=Paenibacillus flagellatus TaxID=2211139 RepID=A0A2V5K4B8_9BACL|nr:phytanoyl-CoA dioxygenase family protein [Paenibacillus flagellatus]PYI53572.1 phytanoyl-CoA dioxygenase family protein [Paenibacillus flagellatus]